MIIVYLSIALAIASLIYLGVSAVRTFKAIQPTVKDLSGTAANMQKQMEGVQKEIAHLMETRDAFLEEIEDKKKLSGRIVSGAKESLETLKSLWEMAVRMPNPQRMERIELSPEIQRITDRLIHWFGLRNKRNA